MQQTIPPDTLLTDCRSIADVVRMRARWQPDKPALIFLEDGVDTVRQWSYADLWEHASRVAARLAQRDVVGRHAVLLYEPGSDYVAAFLGALRAGVVAVSSYPPGGRRATQRMAGIIEDAQPGVLLSTSRIHASETRLREEFWSSHDLEWIETDSLPAGMDDRAMPAPHNQTLAMLQYTSGSTSRPKGVRITHRNLMSNCEACHEWLRPAPDWVGCSWLPPYHDMGLMGGLLQPLYDGFPVVLMAPGHFVQRPARWLRAISRFRCTATGAPNFAFDLCTNEIQDHELEGVDLSCLKVAFCGAEPIRTETLLKFSRRFARFGFPAAALNPCYGLAEATLMVSGKPAGTEFRHGLFEPAALAEGRAIAVMDASGSDQPESAQPESAKSVPSCGRIARNLQVRIVDPVAAVSLPSDTVGEVWVTGDHVAGGYLNRDGETERDFGGQLAGDHRRYLRTGDLGFLRDGELYLTGRIKDLIIIAGRNHYPQDIELTVQSCHPAIQANGVAAFSIGTDDGEALVVVVELRRAECRQTSDDASLIRRAIIAMVSQVHGITPADVRLGPVGTVPRTTSGKIQHRACRQAYLEHAQG